MIALLIALLIYLAGAFSQWSFNPAEWGELARCIVALLAGLIGAWSLVVERLIKCEMKALENR